MLDQDTRRDLPDHDVTQCFGAAVSAARDGHIDLYTLNDDGTWHVGHFADAGRAWAALDEMDEAA
jgi:hypothetical protein